MVVSSYVQTTTYCARKIHFNVVIYCLCSFHLHQDDPKTQLGLSTLLSFTLPMLTVVNLCVMVICKKKLLPDRQMTHTFTPSTQKAEVGCSVKSSRPSWSL